MGVQSEWLGCTASSDARGGEFSSGGIRAGSITSWREAASVRPRLAADGFSKDEAEAAASFVEAVNAFGQGRLPWPRYQQLLTAAQSTRWYGRVEKPTAEEAPNRPFYKSKLGRYLDPLPYWSAVQVPVLAIYGGLDTTVPPESNAPLLSRALQHNPRAVTVVLPNANHQLLRATTGGDDELINLNRYVAGYFDLMRRFLQEVATKRL